MKKFQFLLLDAGPIIKLFELNIWVDFVKRCDVTICRTVANQAKYASQEFEDIRIDLEPFEEEGLIKIFDSEPSVNRASYEKFSEQYKAIIHDGEKQMLAYLCDSLENWLVCSADGAIFRVLGLLGRIEQGISLEEILEETGLSQNNLEWEYTKKFRKKYTRKGQIDFTQGQGLL